MEQKHEYTVDADPRVGIVALGTVALLVAYIQFYAIPKWEKERKKFFNDNLDECFYLTGKRPM